MRVVVLLAAATPAWALGQSAGRPLGAYWKGGRLAPTMLSSEKPKEDVSLAAKSVWFGAELLGRVASIARGRPSDDGQSTSAPPKTDT